ncbi:MAG TPA: PASTA domain-containing protein [Solirubrobacterales bacterium]
MTHRSWRALLIGGLASLALCGSAEGQTIVGQRPAATPNTACGDEPLELAPVSISGGNSYVVPHAGVITSWSTFAGVDSGQQMTFKIVRPFGNVGYTVRAHDGPRPLLPAQVNTFRTAIPVQQGDLLSLTALGTEQAENACVLTTGVEGDLVDVAPANALDGQTWLTETPVAGFRLNVQATVLGAPTLGAIANATGSVLGGTPVVIPGANLAEVSSVTFGGVPASAFSVDSEAQITAITPKSAKLGAAAIEVTTLAGKAIAPTAFSYAGCMVPQLRKAKLSAAKKKLRAAGCKLGKVKRLRGASVRSGKVSRQSPAPGQILGPGAKVAVTLKESARRR